DRVGTRLRPRGARAGPRDESRGPDAAGQGRHLAVLGQRDHVLRRDPRHLHHLPLRRARAVRPPRRDAEQGAGGAQHAGADLQQPDDGARRRRRPAARPQAAGAVAGRHAGVRAGVHGGEGRRVRRQGPPPHDRRRRRRAADGQGRPRPAALRDGDHAGPAGVQHRDRGVREVEAEGVGQVRGPADRRPRLRHLHRHRARGRRRAEHRQRLRAPQRRAGLEGQEGQADVPRPFRRRVRLRRPRPRRRRRQGVRVRGLAGPLPQGRRVRPAPRQRGRHQSPAQRPLRRRQQRPRQDRQGPHQRRHQLRAVEEQLLRQLLHADRRPRHPRARRDGPADDPARAGPARQVPAPPHRVHGPLLALRRPRVDLPVPVAVPDL
ncbi:MAG: Cytochrome c oxidase polypeptide III, partial [uncultured Phycisphaerae bacterium]